MPAGDRSVSVFGPDALTFARALAEGFGGRATIVEVELRHAPGFEVERRDEGLKVHAAPESLAEAVAAALEDAGDLVVGVGHPFAAVAEARLAIWITGGASPLSLPPPLRACARRAALALETPRVETARALGVELRARGW